MHTPNNGYALPGISIVRKEPVAHTDITREESARMRSELFAKYHDKNSSVGQEERDGMKARWLSEQKYASLSCYSAKSRATWDEAEAEHPFYDEHSYETANQAWFLKKQEMKKGRDKKIKNFITAGFVVGGGGYACVHDPELFANDAWGVGAAAAFGYASALVGTVGYALGGYSGYHIGKLDQDKSPETRLSFIKGFGVLGMALTTWQGTPAVYDWFKQKREPYKENAHEATYAPSAIRAQKMAAAASFPTYALNYVN